MRTPEIHLYSQFGTFIKEFVKSNEWIKKILEIGSGSGNASTQCFIYGLLNRADAELVCIESNPEWYNDLVANTKDFPFVKPVNKSSISYDNLLVKDYDKDHWDTPYSTKDCYEYRKPWFEADEKYFKTIKLGEGALENDETYDCVLIDGSEFSGYSEFTLIKDRTKCIMLDDINEFKCKQVHKELLENSNWALVAQGNERNGWSCFLKINK